MAKEPETDGSRLVGPVGAEVHLIRALPHSVTLDDERVLEACDRLAERGHEPTRFRGIEPDRLGSFAMHLHATGRLVFRFPCAEEAVAFALLIQ